MMVEHNQSANHPAGVGYDNKYKFNGKELDDATQMYYYGARYYDPRISIFVSVDPLAEQTMTPYQYVHNNPIMLTDPTGMSAEPPVKGLEYFRDDTGEYFWNEGKDKYEHFAYGKDGSTYFNGYYDASTYKEPVGDYSIIFDLSNNKPDDYYNIENTIVELAYPLIRAVEEQGGKFKDISNQEKYPGVKIYSSDKMNGAVTLGNIIFTNPRMEGASTLDHEYGHYLDFKFHFKFNQKEYIKEIGLPSLISATTADILERLSLEKLHKHETSNTERRANRLGGAWTGNRTLQNINRTR